MDHNVVRSGLGKNRSLIFSAERCRLDIGDSGGEAETE
jgi:hypothetical protein